MKLKQHTPLLHFQHDQEGATLRATEMKPKLDELIGRKKGKTAVKRYAADPEDEAKGALDYKLRISAEKNEEYIVGSSIPRAVREDLERARQKYLSDAPYFADNPLIKEGKWSEARRAVMYKNIRLEVFSFHEELVEWVREALPRVLAYENFGTRQSKGFGSFSLEGATREDFETMLLDTPEYERTLYFAFNAPNPPLREIFKKIIGQDLTEELKKIKTPTLIIWGDRDSYVPLSSGKTIAALIPNSRLEIIPGGKHGLHLQMPERFYSVVRNFIE